MRRTMLKRLTAAALPVLAMLLLAMTLSCAAQAHGDLGRQRARDALKAQSEGQLAQALVVTRVAIGTPTKDSVSRLVPR